VARRKAKKGGRLAPARWEGRTREIKLNRITEETRTRKNEKTLRPPGRGGWGKGGGMSRVVEKKEEEGEGTLISPSRGR